ncbi:MAG: hypothetical protein ABMA64_00695 [Myxococcota bacterium]
MIAWMSTALAAPIPEPPAAPGVHLVIRGLVEQWNEPALAAVYKSGSWLGGIGVVTPVVGPVSLDFEASFRRLRADGTTFEIAPLSGLVELGGTVGKVDLYAGVGPSWTVFSERPEEDPSRVVQGARIGGELRAGLRVDTGLVDPPMPPATSGPVRRLELEVYLGRRAGMPGGEGLLLGAWRGCVGLGFVL